MARLARNGGFGFWMLVMIILAAYARQSGADRSGRSADMRGGEPAGAGEQAVPPPLDMPGATVRASWSQAAGGVVCNSLNARPNTLVECGTATGRPGRPCGFGTERASAMGDKSAKIAKKMAKAAAKAAKKQSRAAPLAAAPSDEARGADGLTPAERAAAAAEQQVRLQRLRVILAAISAAVGLATAAYMWFSR